MIQNPREALFRIQMERELNSLAGLERQLHLLDETKDRLHEFLKKAQTFGGSQDWENYDENWGSMIVEMGEMCEIVGNIEEKWRFQILDTEA